MALTAHALAVPDLEILVHVSGSSSAKDDSRYRRQAAATVNLAASHVRPLYRGSKVCGATARQWEDGSRASKLPPLAASLQWPEHSRPRTTSSTGPPSTHAADLRHDPTQRFDRPSEQTAETPFSKSTVATTKNRQHSHITPGPSSLQPQHIPQKRPCPASRSRSRSHSRPHSPPFTTPPATVPDSYPLSQSPPPPSPPPTTLPFPLEIHPPSQPPSSAPLPPNHPPPLPHALSHLLTTLRFNSPTTPHPTRPLRPLERGHWLLPVADLPRPVVSRLWAFLERFVGEGKAGWGVWVWWGIEEGAEIGEEAPWERGCERGEPGGREVMRLYCWGGWVREIWGLCWVASDEAIDGKGAEWVDGGGEVVVRMG
ncbi:MAG: hypothetical protein M1833_004317 [Piccolia ochrophora]|nr:MAG: hypothetical protein M1833_004317 [Piccolia ochrophora]